MKKIFLYAIMLTAIPIAAQQPVLQKFSLQNVSLSESPFYRAEQTDLNYMLALDPDRLLAPFLKDAGIPTSAESYGNWENTGLDGHIGGHYLSALSMMYASTGNKEMKRRLDYMVGKLAECQQKNGDGYVGGVPDGKVMWKEIASGNIRAQNFSLNDRWVPLYNMHKLFAGLRDAYQIGKNEQAKGVLIKLSDWFLNLTSGLSDEQIQRMLISEHGGLNEVFADVAAITGDNKYLVLADRFSDRATLNPLLQSTDKLTGLHANMQIPKVIGYERIAGMTNNTDWSKAAEFFWNTVVTKRTVSIGGNSVREHFNPVDDFSSMIESNQGPETCNSYNMLRLTELLFLAHPDVKYLDYYERTLYNHILSTERPGGGFVYFTPMRPRHYRVYSQPDDGFWCCVGTGMENHGKYGELIYSHDDHDIYVNLFIPSVLSWDEKGIKLEQKTKFPYEETSSIKLTVKNSSQFAVNIRYPGWVKTGEFSVSVNGKTQKISSAPSSFVSLNRKWKTGDVITVTLPMHTKLEYLPDGSNWASFVHGPIVLAAATDSADQKGLTADDSRMGHAPDGKFYPIDEAPVLVMNVDKNSTAIQLASIKDKPLAYSVPRAIYPEKYDNLVLVPFFELYDTRYMIYWQVVTPEQREAIHNTVAAREARLIALNARTVDWVSAGEQQPEVEHSFAGDRTTLGSDNGRSWRRAEGWFSYAFTDKDHEGKVLRILMPGRGRNRKFDVLINSKLLETVDLTTTQEQNEIEKDIQIPAGFLNDNNGLLTIKLQAKEGATTGSIYEVRLLKAE